MTSSQIHLHSENFDLCRICLLEPESNRHIKFVHIFTPSIGVSITLNQQIRDFLGVKVENNDIKPKIICENCHNALSHWTEMKNKAAESQIVINYIAKKKFGVNASENSQLTSNESDTSLDSRNNAESSNTSHSLTHSKKRTNQSVAKTNVLTNCSSSSKRGSYSQSFTTNQSTRSVSSESDDDTSSCQEVNVNNEVIYVSSDNEELDHDNCKNNSGNNSATFAELNYCSVCKRKNTFDHDCSHYNKEFSTCLVPNCNILSRSLKDFTPHYRQHIGMSSAVILCLRCFQENKKSERDVHGLHTRCRTLNLFKCFTCSIVFNTMPEFASHKLKMHSSRLMNCSGNYLCFYCEKSSPDLMKMNDHIKYCLENQKKNLEDNVSENGMKHEELVGNETMYFNDKKNEFKRGKEKKIPRSAQHLLFTCLKPSCNLIFQNFAVFKFHHREHFEIGNKLMCWQCCSPFSNLNALRMHQVKGNCRTPGMFKCFECTEVFNDLQSLSIHKYTIHDGDLIANKKNKKTIICAFCRVEISIHNFKNHLVKCQYKTDKKVLPKPNLIKKTKYSNSKCVYCGKICLTAAALSSHIKIHNPPSSQNKAGTKRLSNTSVKKKVPYELVKTGQNKGTDEDINQISSSTPQSNETIISNYDIATTSNSKEMYEVINQTGSSSSLSNEATNMVDFEMFPFVDNYYFCIKCPKKFISKKGLKKHWSSCSSVKPMKAVAVSSMKNIPHNYYCSKCKEYYTRQSFDEHWKLNHGRRLPCHKFKRYSCTKCSFKFMYKVALTMHEEHEHGGRENSENITVEKTLNDNDVMLPIISETTSLANYNAEGCIENNELIFNGKIEYEETENTLLDIVENQCEALKNVIEFNINEQNNDSNDLRNNEQQDISNNNDDNNVDVHNIQIVDTVIDELNDNTNNISPEDLMVVDDANEIDCKSEIIKFEVNNKKQVVEVVDDEKNTASLTKEDIQIRIDNMVTTNNSQNVNDNDNIIEKLPISSDKNQVTNKSEECPGVGINASEECLVIGLNESKECSVIDISSSENCSVTDINTSEECSVIDINASQECSVTDINQTSDKQLDDEHR